MSQYDGILVQKIERPTADPSIATVTMTGNETLSERSSYFVRRDPGGANRTLTLYTPSQIGQKGRRHLVYNAADANETITVDATWVIGRGGALEVVWTGTAWASLGMSGGTDGGDFLVPDSGALRFGTPGTDLVITADGTDAVVSATGDLVIADSVDLMIGTGKDLSIKHDGTNTSLVGANGDIIIDNTDTNDQIILRVGTDTTATGIEFRNNSDVAVWKIEPSSASAGTLKGADGSRVVFGTDSDVTLGWTGSILTLVPVADDTLVEVGDGTLSCDVKVYGNIANSYVQWDASADQLRGFGPMRDDVNTLGRRFNLKWVAGQRGKPSLNADIQNAAEATRMIADPDFEILGTNATSDDCTFNAEGGVTIETDGADDDQVIILPHLDANQSAWAQVTWGTDKETEWECHIKTSTSIVDAIIWAGLKLTNTQVTATDDHQVFFRYEEGVNGGDWQFCSSIAGVDTETDTNVAVATSTEYHLKVTIDSSRIARAYINGALVHTTGALTTAIDLIPYIGVMTQAGGASGAKKIDVYGQAISRVIG